jgi:ABC-type amino acid transport substrate-binding protein
MNKILSVVFVILLLVGGYFYDQKSKQPVTQESQQITHSIVPDTVKEIVTTKDSSLERILSNGVIKVGVMSPSKPFFSIEGGRPKGFNVDFLKLILEQNEFRGNVVLNTDAQVDSYEAVPGQLLDNKNIDIVADGLTFTNDDMAGVVYTIPYVKDFGYSLIVGKGTTMSSVSDTAGAKIGVLKGDPDAKSFAQNAFPDARIVELSDKADSNGKWIVGHITSGTVDAVVYDYPFAVAEVEDTDLQFAMAKIDGSDIQYKIGVRKEDKELLIALNSAIRKAMADDSYPDLIKNYFMSKNIVAVKRASASEQIYIVLKGDTLSTIAQAQYGDIKKYTVIQSRNNLANPNFISVGQKLVIPSI